MGYGISLTQGYSNKSTLFSFEIHARHERVPCYRHIIHSRQAAPIASLKRHHNRRFGSGKAQPSPVEANELIRAFTSLEGRGYRNGEKGGQGCCRSKSLDNYHSETIFVFVHPGFVFSVL